MVDKKIVSLIPSYNPHNEYVGQVVEELSKFTKVILFTTENHNLNVDETIYFSKNVGRELVYKPRKWILDNIDQDWDFALYNEDDIFISEQSLNNAIEMYKKLPSPFIPGFIRYELDPRDDTKRYFDMNPVHAVHRGSHGTIKYISMTEKVWEPWNLHSGNWLFSKDDIKTMIENNVFETSYKEKGYMYGNCDQLESAASVPYMFYTKVYPYDFEKVEVEHLPKKYIYFSVNPVKEDIQNLLGI
jgi:hypothetical protein